MNLLIFQLRTNISTNGEGYKYKGIQQFIKTYIKIVKITSHLILFPIRKDRQCIKKLNLYLNVAKFSLK